MSVRITRDNRVQSSLEKYQLALPAALTAAGAVVVVRVQRIHVMFRPIGWAFGHLVRSYTVSPPEYDGQFLRVKVGSTQNYAFWAHWGRPPGKAPPPDAMLDWVREKKIAGSYGVVGAGLGRYPRYKRQGTKSAIDAEDRQAAYLIGRKIAREGTQGFPALLVAFHQARDAAMDVFTRQLITQLAAQR